jgi:hypothetical protein
VHGHGLDAELERAGVEREQALLLVEPEGAPGLDLVGIELQADDAGQVLHLALEALDACLRAGGRIDAGVADDALRPAPRDLDVLLLRHVAVVEPRVQRQVMVDRHVGLALEEERACDGLDVDIDEELVLVESVARRIPVQVQLLDQRDQLMGALVDAVVVGEVRRVGHRVDDEGVVDHRSLLLVGFDGIRIRRKA